MESDFSYGFEYLGSASRLVLTPSSLKMFVSMTQAIEGCKAGLCVGANVSTRHSQLLYLLNDVMILCTWREEISANVN